MIRSLLQLWRALTAPGLRQLSSVDLLPEHERLARALADEPAAEVVPAPPHLDPEGEGCPWCAYVSNAVAREAGVRLPKSGPADLELPEMRAVGLVVGILRALL